MSCRYHVILGCRHAQPLDHFGIEIGHFPPRGRVFLVARHPAGGRAAVVGPVRCTPQDRCACRKHLERLGTVPRPAGRRNLREDERLVHDAVEQADDRPDGVEVVGGRTRGHQGEIDRGRDQADDLVNAGGLSMTTRSYFSRNARAAAGILSAVSWRRSGSRRDGSGPPAVRRFHHFANPPCPSRSIRPTDLPSCSAAAVSSRHAVVAPEPPLSLQTRTIRPDTAIPIPLCRYDVIAA